MEGSQNADQNGIFLKQPTRTFLSHFRENMLDSRNLQATVRISQGDAGIKPQECFLPEKDLLFLNYLLKHHELKKNIQWKLPLSIYQVLRKCSVCTFWTELAGWHHFFPRPRVYIGLRQPFWGIFFQPGRINPHFKITYRCWWVSAPSPPKCLVSVCFLGNCFHTPPNSVTCVSHWLIFITFNKSDNRTTNKQTRHLAGATHTTGNENQWNSWWEPSAEAVNGLSFPQTHAQNLRTKSKY